MRISAVEKMGYYPLPPITTERLAAALVADPSANLTLLDPCAGQGEALAAFHNALAQQGAKPHTFGIELAPHRAAIARQKLDYVHAASYEDITMARYAWSLMLLNPPYDTQAGNIDSTKPRLEYTFLRNTFMRLQDGGLFIYVVPVDILQKSNVRRALAANFQNLAVHKLPPAEYAQFRQITITGHMRDKSQRNEAMELTLENYCFNPASIPELPQPGTWQLTVPPSTHRAQDIRFQKLVLSPQEIIAAATTHSTLHTKKWRQITELEDETAFRPVVPLKIGHLGSLIASGQMGTVDLGDIIAKGYATKTLAHFDKNGIQYDPIQLTPEQRQERADTQREIISTSIFTLDRQGQHAHIKTTDDMQRFLDQYAAKIAHIVQHTYTPLYVEPTPPEWRMLDELMQGRRLPGRKQAGLLPAQKHVAIAAARSAQHQGWADVIGEMGVGKSAITLATIHLLNAYPAIVICPGHITHKWAREVKATIGSTGATPINIESLADLIHFHRTWDRQKTPKPVLIISKERIKLGSGWQHATLQKERTIITQDPITDEVHRNTVIQHFCPRCGQPVVDKNDISLFNQLPNKRLFCLAKLPRFTGDDDGHNSYGTLNPDTLCGAPLFTYHGFRRWPLATYISRKMKGFFKLLVADEVHQYKAKSTDQAAAYHRIADACTYVINATGTYFGGKSTNIFWLRHKMDKSVRQRFEFGAELAWARDYGRLQYTVGSQADDDNDDTADGKFSGLRRYTNRAKEIPGISPKIFSKLLKSAIFLKVADLGYKMPDYTESVVRLDMDPVQRRQYKFLDDTLMGDILACYESYDPDDKLRAQKLLSVWLQNALGRPNSAFRPELIKWTHPALPDFNHLQELTYKADLKLGKAATKPQPLTHAPYGVWSLPNFFLDPKDTSATPANPEGPEDAQGPEDPFGDSLRQELGNELYEELYDLFDSLIPRPITTDPDITDPDPDPDNTDPDNTDPLIDQLHTFFDFTEFEQQIAQGQELLNQINEPHRKPLALYPAIERPDQLLPKEAWLIAYLQQEKKAARKSIVFVRQTGTRDIQPRIEKLLLDAGLRAKILPASLVPAKREKWIDTHVDNIDILIVNPKKVETGMDLIRFSTAIFYELDYSLYTLWQAMRRVWRLGQTKNVKVIFPVYRHTMEESALALMGAKMQAALMLYGDNASSVISEESTGAGDFLAELAQKVLAGEDLSLDGITGLLGDANALETESSWEEVEEDSEDPQPEPEEAPTSHSPKLRAAAQRFDQIFTPPHKPSRPAHKGGPVEEPINMFQQWLQQHAPAGLAEKPKRRKKNANDADSQLSLF